MFVFDLNPPKKGKYRIESVIKTNRGWIKISKDLKLAPGLKPASSPEQGTGYRVRVKRFPEKVYADHVVTIVFDISLDGEHVTGLEKIDGAEIQLAAWGTSFFRRFGDLTYATSAQNLGGPEAAVSLVFRGNGLQKIFAEFKHRGKIQTIETEFLVFFEPEEGSYRLDQLEPSDD